MTRLASLLHADTLMARIIRSAGLTVIGFGVSQLIRLASNLILTRLLFPEAFGMMGIVTVVMMGLAMFSDVGVTPAIMQSRRGDDRNFLDTAWTIQVIRGVGLWLAASVLAWPLSNFYGEPQLAVLLPVAALTLLITGFNPTKLDTANRHLLLGRVTLIDIFTQVLGVVAAVLLALWLRSVWALVLSGVFSACVQLLILNLFLPGPGNRFRWETSAAQELIGFGKWVFLSTICGFFFSQGDRIVLGKLLPLGLFGVYNIGFFLGSFPLLLGMMVTRKILIPIYREKPPRDSKENFFKLRRMRFVVSAGLMFLLTGLAIVGVALVEFLYDPRYHLAGPILVVITLTQIPQVIALTYDQAALAAGDSRRFFVLALARAVFMIAGLVLGFSAGGLLGALVGQGLAMVAVYPVVVWLAVRMGAWDPLHDVIWAVVGVVIVLCVIFIHDDSIAKLLAVSRVTEGI